MEINKIRYMNDAEKKKFATDKKMVVAELKDGSLLFSDSFYYFDKEANKLNKM